VWGLSEEARPLRNVGQDFKGAKNIAICKGVRIGTTTLHTGRDSVSH